MANNSTINESGCRGPGDERSVWSRVFEPLQGAVKLSISVEHSLALVLVYGAVGGLLALVI